MRKLTEIELIGTNAVRKLRENKLKNGHPFMINSSSLPSNQAFLEYPNGSIAIVEIYKSGFDFVIVKQLNPTEINSVRLKYNLFE